MAGPLAVHRFRSGLWSYGKPACGDRAGLLVAAPGHLPQRHGSPSGPPGQPNDPVHCPGAGARFHPGPWDAGVPNAAAGGPRRLLHRADGFAYLDTFVVWNTPGDNTFQSSLSNQITPFDDTYVAAITSSTGNLTGLAVNRGNLILVGEWSTEIWTDVGAPSFPFARVPSASLEHGSCAKYSLVVSGEAVYWLGQDRLGSGPHLPPGELPGHHCLGPGGGVCALAAALGHPGADVELRPPERRPSLRGLHVSRHPMDLGV